MGSEPAALVASGEDEEMADATAPSEGWLEKMEIVYIAERKERRNPQQRKMHFCVQICKSEFCGTSIIFV